MKYFIGFLRDEEGATVIEYALLALLVALAIIGGVTHFGKTLSGSYSDVSSSLSEVNGDGG